MVHCYPRLEDNSSEWVFDSANISDWANRRDQLINYSNTLSINNLSEQITQIESEIKNCDSKLNSLIIEEKKTQDSIILQIEQRDALVADSRKNLESFFRNYKHHPLSLKLFDAVSDLLRQVVNNVSIDVINSAYEDLEAINSEFHQMIQTYQDLLGSLSYQEYIAKNIDIRDRLLDDLWANLRPLQSSTNLELRIDQLSSWKEYLEQLVKDYEQLQELIKYLHPLSILSEWQTILVVKSKAISNQVDELELQHSTKDTELRRNNVEIGKLENDLTEWITLWQDSVHNIPVHLQEQIPDRNNYENEVDYISDIDSIAKLNDWQIHYEDMVKQSDAVDVLVTDWIHRLENIQPGDEKDYIDLIYE